MLFKDGLCLKQKRKLTSMELAELCSQIGAMTGVGINIGTAMEILQKGIADSKLLKVYQEMHRSLMHGSLFSDSMEQTGVFPEMMVNMFRSAEAVGRMKETANQLAVHYQKEHRLENQIRTSLLYPKILMVTSFFMVLFVFWFIVPTVSSLFEGMKLPVLTRGLMSFSSMLRETWYVILPLLLIVSILCRALLSIGSIRVILDRWKVRMPVAGKYLRIIYTARLTRTLSSLYGSGFSLTGSLEIAGRTVGNAYLERRFFDAVRIMEDGALLSMAIGEVDGLDRKLAPILYVGEETGKLDEMLERIAENYEHEAEVALGRMAAMVEPAMILLFGAVIGCILLGIMLPIWNMYGNIG